MSTETITCWRCGAVLDEALFPLRREEVCPACDADLHVCKLCLFYNPSVSDACDEPIAGAVTNKERANFCDYFKPAPGVHRERVAGAGAKARAELDALFGRGEGISETGEDGGRSELDRLFGIEKK